MDTIIIIMKIRDGRKTLKRLVQETSNVVGTGCNFKCGQKYKIIEINQLKCFNTFFYKGKRSVKDG